jgi:hypothetical protein
VNNGLAAVLAELSKLFRNLVVIFFVIGGDIVAGFAFTAIPGTELAFPSCHNK